MKTMFNHTPTIFDLFATPLSAWPMSKHDEPSFYCDIEDKGDHYQLKADLPGVKKEDIKLNFQDGVLTIKAVHHQKATENQGYILNERCEGVYERSFSFEDADVDNINAAFVKGELDVSIGKNKSSEAHAIKIH